jgi:lysophospholipase L1-like esterase
MLRRSRARRLLPLAILLGAIIVLGGMAGLYRLYRIHEYAVHAAQDITASRRQRIVEQVGNGPVVMLGDSLTAQGNWPQLLGDRVANLGEPGSTTIGILERAEMLPPTVQTVFLMGGINDLRTGTGVDDVAQNIEQIVSTLQPRRIYLESVILTADSDLNQRVDEVNARLRYLCESGRCTFVDLNSAIAPTGILHPEMTVDGTHLKPAAYTLWAGRIAPLLAAQGAPAQH